MEVELWPYDYPLNLLALLSVLNELVVPCSFKVIKIREYPAGTKWLLEHLKSIPNVEEQYAAKNWIIEQDCIKGTGDWIHIKRNSGSNQQTLLP